MNLPSLPTDSLYKFCLVGGIALLLSAVYVSIKESEENERKLNSNSKYLEEARERNLYRRMDSGRIEVRLAYFTSKLQRIQERIKKGNAGKNDELARDIYEDSISVLTANAKALAFFNKNKYPQFDYTELLHRSINSEYKRTLFIFYCLAISGAFFIFLGLTDWMKHQDHLDKLQSIELGKVQWQEQPCQSCSTKLKHDLKAKEGNKYCTSCSTGDAFREPELTMTEMSSRIRDRMRANGFPEKEIQKQLKSLHSLDRWKKEFRW
ncbi:MAG: zinc ribbon domain-containing protein [Pseudobacter sp.]|uniref:zinc ribbon domain-containing protein n=1 Tax=Pseudobacter sp. TaxID=2045420 RepID=UPI003F80B5BC